MGCFMMVVPRGDLCGQAETDESHAKRVAHLSVTGRRRRSGSGGTRNPNKLLGGANSCGCFTYFPFFHMIFLYFCDGLSPMDQVIFWTGPQKLRERWTSFPPQVSDYKDEIDRLNRELQEVKKKFYDQKKREMIQQDQLWEVGAHSGGFSPNWNWYIYIYIYV